MTSSTRPRNTLRSLQFGEATFAGVLMLFIATAKTPSALAQPAAKDAEWLRVTEDDLGIKIEADKDHTALSADLSGWRMLK